MNVVLSVEGLGCTLNRVVNNNPLHADRRRISSLTAEAINSARLGGKGEDSSDRYPRRTTLTEYIPYWWWQICTQCYQSLTCRSCVLSVITLFINKLFEENLSKGTAIFCGYCHRGRKASLRLCDQNFKQDTFLLKPTGDVRQSNESKSIQILHRSYPIQS